MSQYTAQILLVIFLSIETISALCRSIVGRQPEKPDSWLGSIFTLLMMCFIIYVFRVAGAFSQL